MISKAIPNVGSWDVLTKEPRNQLGRLSSIVCTVVGSLYPESLKFLVCIMFVNVWFQVI